MKKFDIALVGITVINVTICGFALLVNSQVKYVPTADAMTIQSCPAGSYEIGRKDPGGEPICKLEPTGCPYGDSIPLDSPKCAPPENPAAYEPYVPIEPVEIMQGK